MLLGKVVGEVWSTIKDEKLEGVRFLLVRQVDLQYKAQSNFVVAVDSLDAGTGEIVLVAQGSSARQTKETHNRPVDAVVMAIVDKLNVDSESEVNRDYERRAKDIAARLADQPEI